MGAHFGFLLAKLGHLWEGVLLTSQLDSALAIFFGVTEGIIIGVISWLLGAILAYPLSKGLSDLIGGQFLNAPLVYNFSLTGAAIWLCGILKRRRS